MAKDNLLVIKVGVFACVIPKRTTMLAIDLKSPLYHSWTAQRQDWRVEKWLRTLRISRTKLETHPYFEDVVTLLMFDSWQQHMNQSDTAIWTHCWQHCYHRELALSDYQKRKLIGIVNGLEYRYQAYKKRELKRQHIRARIERKKLAAV